jgi:hypothetical protein
LVLLLLFAKAAGVAEADRNTDMRGIINPETDSGYVGISLTGSTQGKKTVLAALWWIIGLTTKSFHSTTSAASVVSTDVGSISSEVPIYMGCFWHSVDATDIAKA